MLRRGRSALPALIFALAAGPVQLAAQDSRSITEVLESIAFAVGPAGAGIADSIKSRLISKLNDPNTMNAVLGHLEDEPFLNGLLKPLDLKFANVQSDSGENLLGLTYDWSKDFIYDSISSEGANLIGVNATMKASGTLTRDAGLNPRDFVDSKVSISAFGSWGGTLPGNDALFGRLNSLGDSLTGFSSVSELEASGEFAEFFGEVWSRLSNQLYVTFDFSGSLEADQTFDTKQYVLGGSLGLDVKAWQPGSTLAKLNVFDWPAAVLRYLMGSDSSFEPSGVAIPTAVLGVARVNPTDNVARDSLGATEPYYRIAAELAYRSPIVPMSGGSLYLEGSLRHYSEIGPSAAIEAAGLNTFTLYSVSLAAPNGLYVAYSRGQLPFDEESTRVYELGLRWKF